jgi:hypothetical protein
MLRLISSFCSFRSISIKIDPSDPRDGSSPLQSPLSLREPNIKREAFIPVALAQEKVRLSVLLLLVLEK